MQMTSSGLDCPFSVYFSLQIEMANRKGVEIPHGWGVDSTGQVRVTFVQD